MNRILFLLVIVVSLAVAQKPLTEKQAIQKDKIDLKKEYVYFIIHGQVEINGHIFINDTCAAPIMFEARLTGIKIWDGKTEYQYRDCGVVDCSIVHLTEKVTVMQYNPNIWWRNTIPVQGVPVPLINDINLSSPIHLREHPEKY